MNGYHLGPGFAAWNHHRGAAAAAATDRDGYKIGDDERLIEEGLVAAGTAEAPILFTNGAVEPKKADWRFFNFFQS